MKFMKKQILGEMINIDKVAYKEVNFKSKLIEWGQKNKVKLEFNLLQHAKDKEGSPTFDFQVVIEGIASGQGHGYSKKESQQEAAKITLQRLRREPQFIDEVFNAKSNRTKMEEEPVLDVPDTKQNMNFMVGTEMKEEKCENPIHEEVFIDGSSESSIPAAKETAVDEAKADDHKLPEFETAADDDREAIIAAAEAKAFG